jgi:hypothetical protein
MKVGSMKIWEAVRNVRDGKITIEVGYDDSLIKLVISSCPEIITCRKGERIVVNLEWQGPLLGTTALRSSVCKT